MRFESPSCPSQEGESDTTRMSPERAQKYRVLRQELRLLPCRGISSAKSFSGIVLSRQKNEDDPRRQAGGRCGGCHTSLLTKSDKREINLAPRSGKSSIGKSMERFHPETGSDPPSVTADLRNLRASPGVSDGRIHPNWVGSSRCGSGTNVAAITRSRSQSELCSRHETRQYFGGMHCIPKVR